MQTIQDVKIGQEVNSGRNGKEPKQSEQLQLLFKMENTYKTFDTYFYESDF